MDRSSKSCEVKGLPCDHDSSMRTNFSGRFSNPWATGEGWARFSNKVAWWQFTCPFEFLNITASSMKSLMNGECSATVSNRSSSCLFKRIKNSDKNNDCFKN